MSGEQWACEACFPRGGLGVLPQNLFEKVSALIDSGGMWQPSISDSTCTCKLPVKSGTGDCGYRYR